MMAGLRPEGSPRRTPIFAFFESQINSAKSCKQNDADLRDVLRLRVRAEAHRSGLMGFVAAPMTTCDWRFLAAR